MRRYKQGLSSLSTYLFVLFILCMSVSGCGISTRTSRPGSATKQQSSPSVTPITLTRFPVAKVHSLHDIKQVNSETLLSLNELAYLGYVFTYFPKQQRIILTNSSSSITMHIGSRLASINGKDQTLAVPPELITITPTTESGLIKPIAYPFVPLQPLAKLAGWTVTTTPLTAEERHFNTNSTNKVIITKPLHTSPTTLTWQQVTAQKLVRPADWSDSRVHLSPSFSIDASRTGDYSRGRYVAIVEFFVKVTGRAPVYTGDFANFIQTDDGMIINQGTQSQVGVTDYLIPEKNPKGNTSPQLYPIATNVRITRIIYNDGLSSMAWEIQ